MEQSYSEQLQEKTAAVKVSFKWISNRKTMTPGDKQRAAAVFDADHTYLSASHKLMDSKHSAVRKLTTIKNDISKFWKSFTLPYVEDGIRLLRKDDVDFFNDKMNDYKDELKFAASQLDLKMWEVKQEAKNRLGDLYNENDYPSNVEASFDVTWEFPSVEPPNYLKELSPELYKQEQERIAAKFQETVKLAEAAFIQQFNDIIQHLHERLTPDPGGQKKIFKTSAITNFTEFFEQFKKLNIGSNQQLENLVQQAENLMSGVDYNSLKTSDFLKKDITEGLSQIKEKLAPLIVNAPRRKVITPTKVDKVA